MHSVWQGYIELSAGGVNVSTESLASIIGGGVTFQSPPDDQVAPPAEARAAFRLFDRRADAIAPDPGPANRYMLYFSDSVRGLEVGAPVEFRGIPLGKVRSIAVEFDFESRRFRIPVAVDIYPERLYARALPGVKQQRLGRRERLDALVAAGFRAQLRTGNLISGQLYVALELFPDAPKASVDWSAEPPALPNIPGTLSGAQESVATVLRKLEKVPFDRIGADVEKTLASLATTLKRVEQLAATVDRDVTPELRATLDQAKRTMAAAKRTVSAGEGTVGAGGARHGAAGCGPRAHAHHAVAEGADRLSRAPPRGADPRQAPVRNALMHLPARAACALVLALAACGAPRTSCASRSSTARQRRSVARLPAPWPINSPRCARRAYRASFGVDCSAGLPGRDRRATVRAGARRGGLAGRGVDDLRGRACAAQRARRDRGAHRRCGARCAGRGDVARHRAAGARHSRGAAGELTALARGTYRPVRARARVLGWSRQTPIHLESCSDSIINESFNL